MQAIDFSLSTFTLGMTGNSERQIGAAGKEEKFRIDLSDSSTIKSSAIPDASTEEKLEKIRNKDPLFRSEEEFNFLYDNDKKLQDIRARELRGEILNSGDIDYQQKSLGFLNTMSFLSPEEKAMYDELAKGGNVMAMEAMGNIAFTRATMGQLARGQNGVDYSPVATEISVDNIRKYFSGSIVDKTGHSSQCFEALCNYLSTKLASNSKGSS